MSQERPTGTCPALRGWLPAEVSAALESCGAPLDVALLALWRALLARHGWNDGVVLAVGLGGRTGSEAGAFRRAPVAAEFEGDPSFTELARETGRRMAAPRSADGTAGEPSHTFDFAVPSFLSGDRPVLGLACSPLEGRVALEIRCDPDRFREDEVRPLLTRFETLARSAAAAPETPVGRLELLSEAERRRVLVEFNDTARAPAPAVCIHHLIEEQVRRTPDAPAVRFEERELTYGQLGERAERTARRLRELGVGPGVYVGVHAEPSPEMLVGLLAVLKAGGAYVPLDPEYPAERLAFMLEDTAAPAVLAQGHLARIPAKTAPRTLVLDPDGGAPEVDAPGEARAAAAPREVGPDDAAYAIYTSGSTGVPKGVVVSHRNLVHSTRARVSYYGGKVGRFLLLSSFAFDSSVAGLFWTLIDGGTLVLPPAGTHRDPARIGDLMRRERVTHSLCLASHWALTLSQGDRGAFADLDTAIISGEVFSSALVAKHDELTSGARLFNEYGPTEGTVWSVVFDCHEPYTGNKVPIGRPIENTQIYLLDEHQNPVPIGVPGEMYQGGAGVAQGYLNRPELTAERFVPDPFSEEPGARLYRAGDLARHLPDGNIEFLGRIDNQVKIRGYRIELGEIEAVLGRHPALREVAVVCREDTPGDQRLVAYVAFESERDAAASELREHLAAELPAFMLPASFVVLDALPRTSIGKLDTPALPAPRKERPDTGAAYTAPRTAIEEILADIWAEALDLERVGVDDDFFALGGHSILAVRIMSRVRETLRTKPPMRAFFDQPTVAGLASVLESEAGPAAELARSVMELTDDEVEERLARRSGTA